MKLKELKSIVKTAVKEAIQEELKDILLEAVRSPKQVIQSVTPTETIKSGVPTKTKQEIRESLYQLFYKKSWVTDSLVHATVLQHQNPKFRKILGRLATILQKQDKQSWQIRDELQNLSIPVKLIWGKEDQILPSSHAQGLPGSFAVHIFPNTGHMVHIEQSKVINRLIRENSAQE